MLFSKRNDNHEEDDSRLDSSDMHNMHFVSKRDFVVDSERKRERYLQKNVVGYESKLRKQKNNSRRSRPRK